jgi:hypothetical protein
MLKPDVGSSDMMASVIGYGCRNPGKAGWPGADDEQTVAAVHRALDRIADLPSDL